MLVHRRVTPSIEFAGTPTFVLLGGERHCESQVSCPRTQHVPGYGSTRTARVERTNYEATANTIRLFALNYMITMGNCNS